MPGQPFDVISEGCFLFYCYLCEKTLLFIRPDEILYSNYIGGAQPSGGHLCGCGGGT